MAQFQETLERLEQARKDYAAAQGTLRAAIAEHFPPGARVEWQAQHNGNWQRGVVLMTAYDRVKVHNQLTGKDYWQDVSSTFSSMRRIA